MRLLIIEDNKELAASMKQGLEKAGFHIDVSHTGLDGEERAFVNADELWGLNQGNLVLVK